MSRVAYGSKHEEEDRGEYRANGGHGGYEFERAPQDYLRLAALSRALH
jgi:hypothetical protein